MDRDRAAADRGGKDRKGVGGAALAEDGEVEDAEVKHLSLDFHTGQRILSRVHILCQVRTCRSGARDSPRVACAARPPGADTPPTSPLGRPAALLPVQGFREQAKKAMDGVKAKEYQIAKQEVMKAQERIDKARIEQIEKISETQSRNLTALEKVRAPRVSCATPEAQSGCCRVCRCVALRLGGAAWMLLTPCLPFSGAAETAAGHAEDGRKGRRKVNYRAENIRLAGLAEV